MKNKNKTSWEVEKEEKTYNVFKILRTSTCLRICPFLMVRSGYLNISLSDWQSCSFRRRTFRQSRAPKITQSRITANPHDPSIRHNKFRQPPCIRLYSLSDNAYGIWCTLIQTKLSWKWCGKQYTIFRPPRCWVPFSSNYARVSSNLFVVIFSK